MAATFGRATVRSEKEYVADWQPSFGWCWSFGTRSMSTEDLAEEIMKLALHTVTRPVEPGEGVFPFNLR